MLNQKHNFTKALSTKPDLTTQKSNISMIPAEKLWENHIVIEDKTETLEAIDGYGKICLIDFYLPCFYDVSLFVLIKFTESTSH